MRRNAALFIVVASAACFATLAVLTRLAYAQGGEPLPLLAWRFAIASLVLGGFLALRSPATLRPHPGDLKRITALSLTGYGSASVCFFFALQFASASVVTVMLYAYPAMVAVADAVIRKQRIGALRSWALALTFVGCALAAGVLEAEVAVKPLGVALGLAAAAGYSVFILVSERMSHRPRLVVMTYTFGISALGIAAVTLLVGGSLSPVGWSSGLWSMLALIVLFPTLAAVLLFLRGVRELGASRAALVSTLEPVFTIALAAVVLDESLTLVQSAGVALVIAGIMLAEWNTPLAPEPAAV